MKKLILNADDFCLSPVFNDAILKLIEEEAVSSTSVMIDRFDESQREQTLKLLGTSVGIGLHVEFTGDKNFLSEVQRQYELFTTVFGKDPSHLDIHKTDYLDSGYPVITQFAKEKNLPFCNHGDYLEGGQTTSQRSIGAIHKSLDEIIKWIDDFEESDSGELVLHPGMYDPNCKTSLNYEREVDITKARIVKKYCRANGVQIISFSNL